MASVSIVPNLMDALLEKLADCDGLSDVLIVDGPDPVGDDADRQLYVGMADPRSIGVDSNAGDFTQEWPNATAQTRTESGTIRCAALAFDGDGDMKTARDGAFGIVAEVQALLWADTRLGVDGVTRTSFNSVGWDQRQTTRGALCVVLFSIDFNSYLQRSA